MLAHMDLFSMLTSLIAVLIVTQILIYIAKFYNFRKMLNKVPGPKALPFFGLVFELRNVANEDRLDNLVKRNFEFKDGMMRVWVGPTGNIFIRKPRQIEVILHSTTQITKSLIYDYIHIWLGQGLLTSTGQKWFHDRKMITPSFHFGVLEEFVDVMYDKSDIFNECLMEEVKKNPNKPINVFDYSVRCTLDIICETAMGIKLDCQREINNSYGQALHKFSVLTNKRIIQPWFFWDWIYYQSAQGKEFLKAADIMHKFSTSVIKKKQEERQAKRNQNVDNDEDEFGKRKRKALLDFLLDASESENKSMTAEELREQVDTFMFAGHDTTAAAISWALFLLGHHPIIQEKLYQELDEVLGDKERPTQKELAGVKYLELVMKETLRLYPSAPQISRVLTEDTEIDGYNVPKGTNIIIGIYMLHRDPEVWPNPGKFDPDRFLPENLKGRHPYAYVPFSAGPRNCIGQKFAQIEFKIILSSILRKWKVKSARSIQDMKMTMAFILRPHEGIPVHFTPRKSNKL